MRMQPLVSRRLPLQPPPLTQRRASFPADVAQLRAPVADCPAPSSPQQKKITMDRNKKGGKSELRPKIVIFVFPEIGCAFTAAE